MCFDASRHRERSDGVEWGCCGREQVPPSTSPHTTQSSTGLVTQQTAYLSVKEVDIFSGVADKDVVAAGAVIERGDAVGFVL